MWRNLHNQQGVTLTEMLTVTTCIMLLLSFGLDVLKKARDEAHITLCASQLSNVGKLLNQYREDYHRYPEFAPPTGLGDRTNWYDLYAFCDPDLDSFSPVLDSNGIAYGDRTKDPRVPRLLVNYTGNQSVEELCCPSQGPTSAWNDIGPYYYNTNNPFTTLPVSARKWRARWYSDHEQPLAGCQNPEYMLTRGSCWRHGNRTVGDGINNVLYAAGNVRSFEAPSCWKGD